MSALRSPFGGDFTSDDAARLANVLHAVAHPLRLRIVALLAERPLNSVQVGVRLGIHQRFASAQLGVLQGAGLVSSVREGQSIVRSLRPEVLREVAELLNPGGELRPGAGGR